MLRVIEPTSREAQMRTLMLPLLLLTTILGAGCSDDPPSSPGDAGRDIAVDVAPDIGPDVADSASEDADGADLVDEPDVDLTKGLCDPCLLDDECAGEGSICLALFDDERVCATTCDDNGDCPESYFCASFQDPPDVRLCVAERLTCIDRCAGVQCATAEICDPLSGGCMAPLGLCETGCRISAHCAGPDDRCLPVQGTPDGETFCASACDPEAETSECPPDFFCINTDENAPNEGVCYPLRGTCVERCAGVDCPGLTNCDALTGQCRGAQYGPCEPGCTNSAQCGRQQDICLALGIGEGAHCWQDCRDSSCPGGYECANLVGTTVAVCIPLGRDCSLCYADSCFPGQVCDPTTGMCETQSGDCTVDGCAVGFACDPGSLTCVEIGRPCAGASWAVDCDNFATRCTTRIAGTDGVCAEICTTDADCQSGRCRDTNVGRVCLGDDWGGERSCGTLHQTGEAIGTPCTGACPVAASRCVQGAQSGFCSRTCASSADCPSDHVCGRGASGTSVCLPPQCACAGDPALANASAAFDDALSELGLSRCETSLSLSAIRGVPELADLALRSGALELQTAHPLTAIVARLELTAALDAAADTPSAALVAAVQLSGAVVATTPTVFAFPGSESKLTQAVAAFIAASGGTPDLVALEASAASVPADLQDVAAPIIAAAANSIAARNAALSAAGIDAATQASVFAGAPYLLLPGTPTQLAATPDLGDAAVRSSLAAVPTGEFGTIATQLALDVDTALASLGDTSAWTGFAYAVDTPAGAIVIGDNADTLYSSSSHPGPIAVLIDVGGSDEYRVPVAANVDVANGISLLVDLAGADTYAYDVVVDPNDSADLLPSDAAGRDTPTMPANVANGPISLSDVGRQGAGRLGVALLVDLGGANDVYRTLRGGQGAAVFGVGAIFDDGGDDVYETEALGQGAAIAGTAVLWDAGSGTDSYRGWHAVQGFGAGSGVGLLFDRGGDDGYTATPGGAAAAGVLYLSVADRGASNRSLAQGAGAGVLGLLAGGQGILRDVAGADTYEAATYAQGYGAHFGHGRLLDGSGADTYAGRALVQGVGEAAGSGLLDDAGGDDDYNVTGTRRQLGQGSGQLFGWGALVDLAGADEVHYLAPGGGIAVDGGFGVAIFAGGNTIHEATSDASWGFASNTAAAGDPAAGARTTAIFVDAAGGTETYTRPTTAGIGDNMTWRQPVAGTNAIDYGVGVDR